MSQLQNTWAKFPLIKVDEIEYLQEEGLCIQTAIRPQEISVNSGRKQDKKKVSGRNPCHIERCYHID